MEGPPPGHPLHHTVPPPCPGSPWAQEPMEMRGRETWEEAIELGAEGYTDEEKCRKIARQPIKIYRGGQTPQ